MKFRRASKYWGKYLLIVMLWFTACSGLPGQPTPTPATGRVVPARWSRLSVRTAGVVQDVLAAENDTVTEGQVLIRMQGEAHLQAALAAARFELAAAQNALEQLYKNADLRATEAFQAIIRARQEVEDAERYRNNLHAQAPQGDINQARANLTIAKHQLDEAREDFAPYEKKPENNLTRAALLSRLAQAEKNYEAAVRRLNNLTGTVSELDLAEADADLELAKMRLQVAERDYELLKDGPDPAEVELAQERIRNAEAQLAAAEAALDDLELRSPFEGVVAELYIRPNEWVAPGQPVLLLADLEHLWVETTDLSEIDVARISEGTEATLTFDALPDVVVQGKVFRIAAKAGGGSGVNYKVIIELSEIPTKIRWGMTAFVDIIVEE